MEEKMKFEFSEQTINTIIDALLALPAGQVFHILVDIKNQVGAQTDKYEQAAQDESTVRE